MRGCVMGLLQRGRPSSIRRGIYTFTATMSITAIVTGISPVWGALTIGISAKEKNMKFVTYLLCIFAA